MVDFSKSKPRRTSPTQVVKRLSLNIGQRSRPLKMKGRAHWGKTQGISRSQQRVIPNILSPCVYDTRKAGTLYGGRMPFKTKWRFGNQIKTRHQMKRRYGILTNRQLKKIYRATNCVWFDGEFFLSRLERRIATIVWRAGFTQSVTESRRWITNGYFTLNGQVVRSPNTLVEIEGVVGVAPSVWSAVYHRRYLQVKRGFFTNPAPWLSVDYNTLVSRFVEAALPGNMTFSHPVDTGKAETRFTGGRNAGQRRGPSQ